MKFSKVLTTFLSCLLWTSLSHAADAPKAAAGQTAVAIDAAKSIVKWEGTKVIAGKHHGTIKVKEGSINWAAGAPTSGKVVVDMKSIVNLDIADKGMNEKLVGHLSSPDFFDVQKFPVAELHLTQITPNGKDQYKLVGNLKIKDVSRPVTMDGKVDAADPNSPKVLVKFTFDRTEWNVRYGSGKFFKNLGDKMISDPIHLDAEIVLSGSGPKSAQK